MYNYDDIMARLRAGEDSEVIAKEMVDTLNRANKDYVDEQNAAQNQKQEKAEMVENMLNILETYVRQFHPENPLIQMFDAVDRDIHDINDLVEQVDEAIESMAVACKIMEQVKGDLDKILASRPGNPVMNINPTGRGDAITPNRDSIAAFLKANGLA